MKKNLVYTVLMAVVLGLASCDFLDKMPDQRTQIDTKEKIAKLLVSAYTISDYALMCELSSDNMMDNNTLQSGTPQSSADPFYDEAFAWQDVVSGVGQDSPQLIWQNGYKAIATANAALDAIVELEAKAEEEGTTIDLKAERGEALLSRAYHHFMLVNVFAHHYKGDASKEDLGIPYMEESEKTLHAEYTRMSVYDVYEKIEKDLEDGIKLIDDAAYTVPKYHFNTKAAHAFAARFYLYKRQYGDVIEHANLVLGGSPEAAAPLLRDMEYISKNTTFPDNEVYEWINAERDCNLLLISTYSNFFLLFGYPRYGVNGDASTAIFGDQGKSGPNWTGRLSGLKSWTSSANYGAWCAKVYAIFEYVDKIAGTGFYRRVHTEFTTNETLLCLAEALVYTNRHEEALAYLEAWTKSYMVEDPLREMDLNLYATNNVGQMPFVDNLSYATNMGIQLPSDERSQRYLRCILHFRRIETVHDGLRWFDIKRYGIPVTHVIGTEGKSVTLNWNDERRAIQLPQDVIFAGIKANPRSFDNKGTAAATVPFQPSPFFLNTLHIERVNN